MCQSCVFRYVGLDSTCKILLAATSEGSLAFNPGLLRAYLELHQGMQRDKGVATKWKEFGSQKWTCFVNAYLSRFLLPVRGKRFEVVELRYDSAGNVRERLVMEPTQLK